LTRRKDLEEDTDIDILRGDDSYPRRPQPIIALQSRTGAQEQGSDAGDTEGQVLESEEGRAVRFAAEVYKWAIGPEGDGADGDTWEGCYISLDLISLDPDPEGEDNADD
jgi:COMPASS component SWD1